MFCDLPRGTEVNSWLNIWWHCWDSWYHTCIRRVWEMYLLFTYWHFLWTEGQARRQNFSWFLGEQEKAAGCAWPYGFEIGLGQTIWDEGQGLCGWTFPGAKGGRPWLSHQFNSLRTRKGRGGIWKLSSLKCQNISVNFSYSIWFIFTELALWMGLLFVHGLEHHLLGVRKILLAMHIFQTSIYFII